MQFEYGIIGGGPAGYTAGMMLAKQGKSVVIFEKEYLGGTCLNKGCIPTKSFLHYSELFKDLKNSERFGINTNFSNFDFSKVVDLKNQTVEKVRKSLELAIKNSKIQVINNEAEIIDEHSIKAGDEIYKIENIILATGSKPKEIKGLEFDGEFLLSSDDVLKLKKLPKSVVIVGSGAIGIEWARILSNFGVEVSIIEMAEHLLPLADIEISKRIERIFKQNKIKFFLNNSIEKIENKNVILKTGEILNPDFVLVAVGRTPNLPKCKCEIDNLQQCGDICSKIQLAHNAIHQAKQIVLNIPYNLDLIPSVIYGSPEIAWVGIREQDIDETYKKIMLPITALGKAWCDEVTEGFIKLIVKDDIIKGAHIMSKEASSLIHILLIAIQKNMKIDELKEVCFAHPTYAEGIFEALLRL